MVNDDSENDYPICHCKTGAHTTRKGYAASVTLVPRERLRSYQPPGAGTSVKICRAGACPRRGTTDCVQACSLVLSAAYAVGGGMPPPYNRLS